MRDFLFLVLGFAGGCVWGAVRLGTGGVLAGLKRLVPLGGGGPDPTDPRK